MFNIAFHAADTDDAKGQLESRSGEQETPMPDAMREAVNALIDGLGGSGAVGFGAYGDDTQINVSLMRLPNGV